MPMRANSQGVEPQGLHCTTRLKAAVQLTEWANAFTCTNYYLIEAGLAEISHGDGRESVYLRVGADLSPVWIDSQGAEPEGLHCTASLKAAA